MIDRLFFLAVVLNATGLFRFVAPQIGVEVSHVTTFMLLFNVSYIAIRQDQFGKVLASRIYLIWILLLIVWPISTLAYTPVIDARDVGLQLYYASLFTGTIIYVLANGLHSLHYALFISLLVTLLGNSLSMAAPEYFEDVARLTNAKSSYHERAFGFFMQPNAAATGLLYIFVGWYAMWSRKQTAIGAAVLVAFLVAILLTGSRTLTVAAAVVCIVIVIHAWRFANRFKSTAMSRVALSSIAIIAFLTSGIAFLYNYSSQRSDSKDLYRRIELLTSFRLTSNGITADRSIRARFDAQRACWKFVQRSPLIGHGLGAESKGIQSRRFKLSAHNTFLTTWLEFGFFYPFLLTLTVLRLGKKRIRFLPEAFFETNSIAQFTVVTIFLFYVNGNLLERRGFWIVLAMLVAVTEWPQLLLKLHSRPVRNVRRLRNRLVANT